MTDPGHTRELLQISCADALERLTDHLEGALAPADATRMQAHLTHCEPCRVYLDQLRSTIRLAGQAGSGAEYRVDAARLDRLAALFRLERDG